MRLNRPFARWTALLILAVGCSDGTTTAAEDAAPADAESAVQTWRQTLLETAEAALADGKMVIPGMNQWLYFTADLRHLGVGQFWGEPASEVSRANNADWADPIPAIVDFHQQLKDAGVDLVIVPVPAKAAVYPQFLPETLRPAHPDQRLDTVHESFYQQLQEKGISVLDLTPLMRHAGQNGNPPLYCRQDTHWSGAACILTAQALAEKIKEQPWYEQVERQEFSSEMTPTTITGDLYAMLEDASIERETLPLRFIKTADGQPVQPDRDSPVLLLGDSHTLVFHSGADMHATGAGLLEQLAHELGFAPDLIGVRGSGATPSRIALMRRGDNLEGKKLVIWVFSVREFTEGQGWRKVPVIR